MTATDTLPQPTLFDEAIGLEPSRVRRTDPVTSHQAADKSARGISKLRYAVLITVATFGSTAPVGSEINERYKELRKGDPIKFPKAHPDSPRKRAGELADALLLDVKEHREGLFGNDEAAYALSPEGRKVLAS